MLPTLVRRLAPTEVEIETVTDFEHAEQRLREHPPGAAIVNVSASDLPWARFRELCERNRPPIPVLFESCVFDCSEDAGIGALSDSSGFITKPHAIDELRLEIKRLMDQAHRQKPGRLGGKRPVN